MLQAQPQRPDGARGPTTTLSRQIPRPAALVIDCDAGVDDDVAEPPLSAKNHHASPASHSRQLRDRRSPAEPGAKHRDSPRGATVGRVQGGRRSAVAQASSPSSTSSLDPAYPSATSPRFPCAIPSPRLIPMAAPTAYQQSPRQQVLPTASLGGISPAIHRQSTIATGSPAGQMERRRQEPGTERGGQRRGSNCGGSSSRQLSRFHTWDSVQLDGEPTPQITPPPVPPSCREHRPRRGFSGRQHAEVQSEQLWAEGADWEEGDWRGADGGDAGGSGGGGVAQAAAGAHAAAPCTGPRGMPSQRTPLHADRTLTLSTAALPRRAACDERTVRHARAISHGSAGVGVQRVAEIAGATENAQWVGEECGGLVQTIPWKEEGDWGDMEAMRGWQGDVEGAGLECGGVERHGPILVQVQHAALVPDLGDGPLRNPKREADSFQHRSTVVDSLEASKQQSRPRGRPDGQRSSEDADAGGVRGSESKGSSKRREKPKSKLQRSLSDDDEEEEEQAKVVRPSRDDSSRRKQQGKKGALLKVSKSK
ncbi:unnamed protein product [Closterium sp. Naga37s-1]|nr:unnamed protein product [Closterium sp. Naga37s-1]